MNKTERQIQLETEAVDLGVEQYRKALNKRGQAEMTPGRQLLNEAILRASEAILFWVKYGVVKAMNKFNPA